jgi:hypothetical protein
MMMARRCGDGLVAPAACLPGSRNTAEVILCCVALLPQHPQLMRRGRTPSSVNVEVGADWASSGMACISARFGPRYCRKVWAMAGETNAVRTPIHTRRFASARSVASIIDRTECNHEAQSLTSRLVFLALCACYFRSCRTRTAEQSRRLSTGASTEWWCAQPIGPRRWSRLRYLDHLRDGISQITNSPEFLSGENAIDTRSSFGPFSTRSGFTHSSLGAVHAPTRFVFSPRTYGSAAVLRPARTLTTKPGKPMAETDRNYSPLAPAMSPLPG